MIQLLKRMFGIGTAVDLRALIQSGAQIIDVRSAAEYQSGHIKNSINIPLPDIAASLQKIKKDRPVITCCASGMRSASAKALLKSNGYSEVYNGGGWMNLQQKIS
jgi:rhodanese-related sulfurtransferase